MRDAMQDGAKPPAEKAGANAKPAQLKSLGDRLRHYMNGEMTPMPLRILLTLLHLQRAEEQPAAGEGAEREARDLKERNRRSTPGP